jgi:radical SAM-linked protein
VKIRLSYGKWGKVRFLGHLDMARLWERGLRKASAPVAMSAGFTPRPKMSFGLALPTGAESVIELFDVTLDETRIDAENGSIDLELLRSSLTDAMPLGVEVVDVDPIAPQKWSLQEDVTATTWVLAVDTSATDPSELDERVAGVVSSTEIWVDRERKGERRRDDVRPGILDLRIIERGIWPATSELSAWADSVSLLSTDIQFVEATLTTSGRGVRPTEMAEVLRPGVDPWITMPRVVRTHQWIGRDDAPRVSARAGKDITHDHSLEQRLERRSEHSVAGSFGGYD